MKRKFLLFPLLGLAIYSAVIFFVACHKQNAAIAGNQSSAKAIEKARQYFESNILTVLPGTHATNENPRAALHKSPIWEMAYATPTNDGDAVVVPVSIKEHLYLKMNQGKAAISAGLLTYLLIYPDNLGNYHTEVVTKIPGDDNAFRQSPRTDFSGLVRVEDWQGNFLKAYHYSNGVADKRYSSSSVSHDSTGARVPARAALDCVITEWYNCWVITDDDGNVISSGCNFDSVEETCTPVEGGSDGPAYSYQIIYRRPGRGATWMPNPLYDVCQDISFTTDGDGNYVANLNGLLAAWKNAAQGNIALSFPNTCIKIPGSGITQFTASRNFGNAYGLSLMQILTELNNGVTSPENAASRFISLVQNRLSGYVPGSSWDPYENCDGSAATNTYLDCTP